MTNRTLVSYCNVLLVYIAINNGKKLLQTSDNRVGALLPASRLQSISVKKLVIFLAATNQRDTMAPAKTLHF